MDTLDAKTCTDPLYFFGHSVTGAISRTLDWSVTALGNPINWPSDLKIILGMMFHNRHPVCIFWGKDSFYFYNDAYISIVGLAKHPQAMGRPGVEVWQEIWPHLSPQINQVMSGGEATWHEDQHLKIIGDDGALRDSYFTYSYSPIFLESGKVGGVLVTCTETTKRIQAEEAVKVGAKQVEDLLESMSDAFFSIDQNWIIERINAQFEKVIKISRSDVLGRSLIDLYFSTPEQKNSLYVQTYTRVMAEGKPLHFVDYYAPFDIWTSVWAYPNTGGGVAVFFKEISEEKRAAKKLQDAIESRDNFLSIASHELRTPITGMKLQVQMMERSLAKNDPNVLSLERVTRLVRQTSQGIDKVNRLVNDMLDISRVHGGKLKLDFEPVELNLLIGEITEKFSEQLASANISLSLESDVKEIIISLDRFRFEQVLTNLITNVIRYAPNAPFVISLRALDEDFIKFTFQDGGPGISLANREKVFERYERLVSANEVSGFGLGLYIAREIIISHGGSISVEDSVKPGAKFLIRIPRLREEQDEK